MPLGPCTCLTLLLLSLALLAGCVSGPASKTALPSFGTGGVTVDALLRQDAGGSGGELVRLAQSQLGRPYRFGGISPDGFDCSGLIYYIHREAGIAVPRSSSDQFRAASRIPADRLLPGDLVFFTISSQKISHVGLYVADDLFIHSPSSGKGVSYASLNDDYWRERLVGAGRFY